MQRRLVTRRLVEAATVLAFYAVVAVVVTWPIASALGSRVLGVVDSDSGTMIWWLDVLQHHGFHLTGTTHVTEVAAPYGADQANALNIQWAWPFFPAYLLTKWFGAVAAYNLTILTGLTFSGAATYALARKLGVGTLVAGWAGLVFLLFPWHLEHVIAGHPSLIHLECLPLLALALILLGEGRSRRRLAYLVGAVLLCWTTSGYYGVIACIAVTTAALTWALTASPRRPALQAAAGTIAVTAAVSFAVVALSLAGGGDGGVGGERPARDVTRYGLRPLELVVPAGANPLFRRFEPAFWETRKHDSNIQETSNYLGWMTLGLALGWLIVIRRLTFAGDQLRRLTGAVVAVGVVAFILALPGSLGGHAVMPSRLLFELVPAFRVPSRWTPVIELVVVMLAALGLAALLARIRGRVAATTAIVAVVVLASVIELRVTHPGIDYRPNVLPPEYRLLDSTPAGTLAEYPMVAWENTTLGAYLLWQRKHGRPLVNVAPSPWRSPVEGLRRTLVDPSAPGTAAALAALGARTVITRPDTLSRALEQSLPDAPPQLGDGFRLVGTTPDGASVWRVTAAPAPAVAFGDTEDFGLPGTTVKDAIVQPLTGTTGVIHLDRPTGGAGPVEAALRLTVYSTGAKPVPFRLDGRSLVAVPEGTPVGIPLAIAGRTATVRLETDTPGAVAIGAPRVER